MKKLIIVFSIFILLFATFTSQVYAIDDILEQGKEFVQRGEEQENPIKDEELKPLSNTIYNILLTIAILIAVGYAMVLGISFMMGSVDEQAKIKESLIPFVVGCIVVFGAFGIWKIIATMLQGI